MVRRQSAVAALEYPPAGLGGRAGVLAVAGVGLCPGRFGARLYGGRFVARRRLGGPDTLLVPAVAQYRVAGNGLAGSRDADRQRVVGRWRRNGVESPGKRSWGGRERMRRRAALDQCFVRAGSALATVRSGAGSPAGVAAKRFGGTVVLVALRGAVGGFGVLGVAGVWAVLESLPIRTAALGVGRGHVLAGSDRRPCVLAAPAMAASSWAVAGLVGVGGRGVPDAGAVAGVAAACGRAVGWRVVAGLALRAASAGDLAVGAGAVVDRVACRHPRAAVRDGRFRVGHYHRHSAGVGDGPAGAGLVAK